MKNIVLQLLKEQKEGDWWDFKQEHHTNPASLLHDILCLSNVIFNGDRYLIFGVNDDYEVVGLEDSKTKRTQADIVSYLKTKSFSFHNIPEVELSSIIIDDKVVDVLTIKNRDSKPYFLTKDEIKNGVKVRSGTVYSRSADVNTPKDSCANPYEIQAMWRERFGLDKKASERFVDILRDTSNWKYDGVSQAFYDLDPDYTIQIGDDGQSGGKFWWEANLVEQPDRYYYYLRYKNVELHKVLAIRYRSENLCIPYPSIEYITYPEKKDGFDVDFYCDLFYFIEGTIEHSLLIHIRTIEIDSPHPVQLITPLQTQIKPPIIELPFPIFRSEADYCESLDRIRENLPTFLQSIRKTKSAGQDDNSTSRYDSEEEFGVWSFELVRESM